MLDLLSVIPIGPVVDRIGMDNADLESSSALKDINNIARVSKIMKMYRLIKLTK
jgi:hypothetical protein